MQLTKLFYTNRIVVTAAMLYMIMISQQVHGKVITVNNNGTSSLLCCKHGLCMCSSLYMALTVTDNNTVINITSPAVSLNTDAVIGIGNFKLNDGMYNITITSSGGTTVMCNNTGTVLCAMCSNVTVQAITWNQCGSIDYPNLGGITFFNSSGISIIDCIFQNSIYCVTVEIFYSKGSIRLINSKFISNTVSNASLCNGSFYSSLLIQSLSVSQTESNTQMHIFINNSLFYFNENANQQISLQNGSLVYHNTNLNFAFLSILVENTTFISNGIKGMYIYDAAVSTNITLVAVNISNSNQGAYILHTGGGKCFLLNIFSSTFTFNNNGALYIEGNGCANIGIHNTTYAGNKGNDHTLGTAISVSLSGNINDTVAVNILFCNFLSNNGGDSVVQISTGNKFVLIDLFITSSNFILNKNGSALRLTNCLLKLHSSILFQDNSARSGAALYVAERSQISVDDGSTVQFINNTASLRGGAMYIDLTNCRDHGIVFTNFTRYDSISFINNSAKLSGNSIYFDIPNSCDVIRDYTNNNSAAYVPYKFNYTQSHNIIGPAVITSPYEINLCSPAKCDFKTSTNCAINNHIMLGQSKFFNATVCDYFGAISEMTSFGMSLINHRFNYRLLEDKILVDNASRNAINILSLGADRDLQNNTNISLSVSSLFAPYYRQLTATLSLTLSSCYNGFLFTEKSQQCECYNKDDYLQCDEDSANIKLGFWFGLFHEQHTLSMCCKDYCNFFTHRKETMSGFYNLPKEIDDQCNSHRTGVACGQCSEGYTLAYNSPDCISVEKCSPGMTVLIIVLTALYWFTMVAILFGISYYFKTKAKISLGYLYGLMYFYSTVDILLTSNLYITDKVFYTVTSLSGFATLNPQFLGRFCFLKNLDVIDQQFIHYCHAVCISIILIGIFIAAKCHKGMANYVSRYMVQAVCLLLLLSYPTLTSISLLLLRTMKFDGINGIYTYISPHIKYFSDRHAAYASVALLCGLVVTIGFPLFLATQPLMMKMLNNCLNENKRNRVKRKIKSITEKHIWLVRIKLLLDQLQDCYKDQHRWFAAYYLICRLVIILITYYANDDYNYMIYYLQTACVVIAMTHIWIQPYKIDLLNKLDTVILLIMLLVVNVNTFSFFTSTVSGITITLVTAPLFLWVSMAAMRMLRHSFGFKVKRLSKYLVKKLQQGYQRNIFW